LQRRLESGTFDQRDVIMEWGNQGAITVSTTGIKKEFTPSHHVNSEFFMSAEQMVKASGTPPKNLLKFFLLLLPHL
jgi:hypothetical protein